MQAEKKKEEHHFDPYVRLEVLESEHRLKDLIHDLEVKMLHGFSDLEVKMLHGFSDLEVKFDKRITSSFRWYFGALTTFMTIGFGVLTYLQHFAGK